MGNKKYLSPNIVKTFNVKGLIVLNLYDQVMGAVQVL
jgi:hypothetical protein